MTLSIPLLLCLVALPGMLAFACGGRSDVTSTDTTEAGSPAEAGARASFGECFGWSGDPALDCEQHCASIGQTCVEDGCDHATSQAWDYRIGACSTGRPPVAANGGSCTTPLRPPQNIEETSYRCCCAP